MPQHDLLHLGRIVRTCRHQGRQLVELARAEDAGVQDAPFDVGALRKSKHPVNYESPTGDSG
jgi:hypothetical protein